jgi:hypothetical protein
MASKERLRLALRLVEESGTQPFISAPPILNASSHTTDFICGAVLMHTEDGQVHNLLIRCTECVGSIQLIGGPPQLAASSQALS